MKAVVVGGCGFIGSYVSRNLESRGAEVVRVHREAPHGSSGSACVSLDYRDGAAMRGILRDADAVVHLASQSVPRTSVELGVGGILAEVEANALLFQTAGELGVGRLVFASSGGSVYGESPRGSVISESQSTHPITPHGLLKVMTELALAHIARSAGVEAVSLRPGNVYGPGQNAKRGFGVVPTFVRNLRAGEPSEIWGAETVRDYIFIEDAADAFVEATLSDRPLPDVMNVGTGIGHTALEVYSMLQEELNLSAPVRVLTRPLADPEWSVLNPESLETVMGLSPRVDLREGLRRTVLGLSSRVDLREGLRRTVLPEMDSVEAVPGERKIAAPEASP